MKDKAWNIIAIIAVLGVLGVIIWSNTNNSSSNQGTGGDAARFHKSYPRVPKNNKFVYATNDEILDIFDSGTGLVFLGFPDCPWCQELAPIVNTAAEQAGLDKIYYLDIQQARSQNDDVYQKLLTHLRDYLSKDEDGEPRIYVPDLTAVSSGEIVGRFKQEPSEEATTADTYWTAERTDRAINQIKEMIAKMNTTEFSKIENEVKNGTATLLDVRTPQEFREGHFPGAVNLDLQKISDGATPEKPKDSKIYLYCQSGNRSAQATSLLKQSGFTNITDLGGLSDVKAMGGELVAD